MKKIICICFCLSSMKCFSNIAMPGIWNAGAGSTFTPLYAEDSLYFGVLQMMNEKILVDLFPGFAVVKGEYYIFNPTDSFITMHIGYPVNGTYDQSVVEYVQVSDLYALQVRVNVDSVFIPKLVGSDSTDFFQNENSFPIHAVDQWYVWRMRFQPGVTQIIVYFIVNTQDAQLRRGYDVAKGNAFTYVLETGRAWARTIDSGDIWIRLNGGLTTNDIMGILPDGKFLSSTNIIHYSFAHLEPQPSDNIVLWYAKRDDAFVFQLSKINPEKKFSGINEWKPEESAYRNLKPFSATNFKVSGAGGFMVWLIMFSPLILLIAIVAAVIAYIFYRRRKRSKQITLTR